MKYYIDLGSATIKVYQKQEKEIVLIKEKSMMFKKEYTLTDGISNTNYQKLFLFFRQIKEEYEMKEENTKIIATGVWRKIPKVQLENLKADFHDLGFSFTILTQEQENYYFAKAMEGIYHAKKVLMVNMGGKTTELVVINKGKMEESINLSIGVADLLEKFPNMNEPQTEEQIEEITKYIKGLLERNNLEFQCDIAVHTGGELRFQKLLQYPLVPNTLFKDSNHPVMVRYKDFAKRNQEIMKYTSLKELYSLMPDNPHWMDGSKAGILLGQVIFEKAKAFYIIPSDLNIIYGIIKEEQSKIEDSK